MARQHVARRLERSPGTRQQAAGKPAHHGRRLPPPKITGTTISATELMALRRR